MPVTSTRSRTDMRILITAPDLTKQGGVATYISNITRHLSVSANVFTVGHRDQAERRLGGLTRAIGDSEDFHRTIMARHWDVIHLNPSLEWKAVLRDGVLLRIAERKGLKTVVFFHGWNRRLAARLAGLPLQLFRRVYFRAGAIVVLAREFKDQLRVWGYGGPVYVETVAFADELLENSAREKGLSRPCQDINMLFFARIERTKGIYETMDAFSCLKDRYPRLRLTVAGDGSELNACKKYARERGVVDVEFPGYLCGEQKTEVLRRADICVFPSSFDEGMPLSVVEAMASGLPVVTRPVGGLKDFFVDGRMGFITESMDHRVFADLTEKLVIDPDLRSRIGHYNREYAKERFTASRVARRIEAVYRDVLGPAGHEEDNPIPRTGRKLHIPELIRQRTCQGR